MNARRFLIAIPAGLIIAGLAACGSGEAITGDGTGTDAAAGISAPSTPANSSAPAAIAAGATVQIADSGQPAAGPDGGGGGGAGGGSGPTTSGSGKGPTTSAAPTSSVPTTPSIHLELLDPPTCSPSTPKSPVAVRWTSRYATNVFIELMPPIVAPVDATPLFLVSDEVPDTGTAVLTFDCSKPIEYLYGRAVGLTAPLADGLLAIANNESVGQVSPTTIKIKIP